MNRSETSSVGTSNSDMNTGGYSTSRLALIAAATAITASSLVGCNKSEKADEPPTNIHEAPIADEPTEPVKAPRAGSEDRTTPVNLDDPRMHAAAEEARAKWPEFVEAVKAGNRKQKCLVKSGFVLPNNDIEYVWITVTGIEGSTVTGTLNSRPFHVAGLQQDQVLSVDSSSVADWVVAEGKEIKAGGFQMNVLNEMSKKKAAE